MDGKLGDEGDDELVSVRSDDETVTVTVIEALVLRPLLEDRRRITESIRILVPINRK